MRRPSISETHSGVSAPAAPAGRRRLAAGLALLMAAVLVYAPVANHEFVNFDDNLYVTENRRVLDGITPGGLRWAVTSLENANWHPLTWASHMLDVQLFGPRPGAHHLVNAALHAANALLLLYLLQGMTGAFWRPLLAAALFALHPLRVESVAWVSERKDVLSAFLMLCAIAAYLRHARRPGRRSLSLVTLLFALGLMAKPMLVTFPFVLLLLDFWPFGRLAGGRLPFERLVLEKTPLFVLSAASSVVTYVAQKSGGAMSLEGNRFLGSRVSQALVSYAEYLDKTFRPFDLSFFYPRAPSLPPLAVAAAAALLAALLAGALLRARVQPYLAVGWLWFAGTLVPVIGIVRVGTQAMADRYTYIPHIGLFVALVWLGEALSRPGPARRVAGAGAAALLIVGSAVLARQQVGVWRNTETLMRDALSSEGGNWLAEVNIGELFERQGRAEEAGAHFRNAVRLNPLSGQARYNLATNLARRGGYAEALEHFQAALVFQPGSPLPLNNLALTLSALGRHGEAAERMGEALRVAPADARGHFNLGLILAAAGRLGEAERAYRRALEIDDGMASGHNNLGILLARQGRMREAAEHFSEAVRLDPADRTARENLARALGRGGGAR
jgi:Flp pilus assembly protein TadD